MYPRGGGRIEGMDNLDRSMIILMSMVYILARACDVSERCQSHLGRILAGELSEVEKEARSSIFLFQRFLEGEEGLPYAWEVIRLPESNLGGHQFQMFSWPLSRSMAKYMKLRMRYLDSYHILDHHR